MNRHVLAALLAAAVASFPAPSRAQTPTTLKFTAVDAVEGYYTTLSITGVLEGQEAPTAVDVHFSTASSSRTDETANCQRSALLAMERPGRYVLELRLWTPGYPKCKLVRASP